MKNLVLICFSLIASVTGTFAVESSNSKDAALIEAVMIGNFENVQKALKKGANINARDDRNLNWTALMWSIQQMGSETKQRQREAIRIFRLLIRSGADVNLAEPKNGFVALHVALANLQRNERLLEKVVKALLKKGANPNQPDSYKIKSLSGPGVTPLMEASRRGLEKIVTLLIGAGADINAKSKSGITPLGYAIEIKHNKIADLLKKTGGREQ